jgi:hypothetical protein
LAEPQSFICANLLYVSWAPNIEIFITPVATMRGVSVPAGCVVILNIKKRSTLKKEVRI